MQSITCLILTMTLGMAGLAAEPLTLDDTLRLGLRNHPDILAADTALKVRLAETLAIEEIPNPRLEAELRSLTDQPALELKLMQPLRQSYFGLRRHYASAQRAAARAETHAQLVAVLNDLVGAHTAVWAAQAHAEAFASLADAHRSLRPAVANAVDAGQASAVDLAMLDADIQRLEAERDAAEPGRLAAAATLAHLTGTRGDLRVATPVLIPLPAQSTRLEHFATQRTPLRAALAAREIAARQQLQLAQRDRLAPVEVGLVAEHDSARGGLLLGVGFTLDLPVWNRNEAAVRSAEASLAAARSDLLLVDPERVMATVKIRHRAALAAEQAAARWETQVVPGFESALATAREALARAQAQPGQLEQILARLGEARLRALELRIAALEARARLENAIGGRIEEALAHQPSKSTTQP